MKSLVNYFLRFPIWGNVLMLGIFALGFIGLTGMRSSFFPESKSNIIVIDMIYPGTSPQEIEESLVIKVENKLEGISGVDYTVSGSSENRGTITVFTLDSYDVNEVLIDVKNAVDQISPYPGGAEKPKVYTVPMRIRTLNVAITGNADLWALKERAETFKDMLLSRDGVSQVNLEGLPVREIAIEFSDVDLDRYHLTFNQVAASVRASNLDLSGGTIETDAEELVIRAYSKENTADAIRMKVIRNLPGGGILRVGDVARVEEKWSDVPTKNLYNGKRAVVVTIDQTSDEDLLFIANQTYEVIDEFNQKYSDVETVITQDATVHLQGRIDLLTKNGSIGFVLVVLILGFFLNWRVSFWVALGIPISFAGMFIVTYIAGITLNVLSLFGMILVVGILVDDAIVVAEQIYQEKESGFNPHNAARRGTLKVLAPVFTAVMTTILAFTPFFFFQGQIGKMVWQLALVVVSALIFSLIESMLILPSHLSHSKGMRLNQELHPLRKKIESFISFFTHQIYGKALFWSMNNKLITTSVLVALVLMTMGIFKGKLLEFNPMPDLDRDDIGMNITLTSGTQENITDSILQAIETVIWDVNTELTAERSDSLNVVLSIQRTLGHNQLKDNGGHAGMLSIQLLDGERRNMKSKTIEERIRKELPSIEGVQKLTFSAGHWGKAVDLSIMSDDLAQLEKAKQLLKTSLDELGTLKDITDSDLEGKKEVYLTLKPKAEALGISQYDIATQIRNGFFGVEAQRLQRGEDEIQIWVRYQKDDRTTLAQLEKMQILTPTGARYPLRELVDYSIARGLVAIQHIDGKREVRIQASKISSDISTATIIENIQNTIIPEVLANVENVQINFEGQERNNRSFNKSLLLVFPALGAIAVILILVFRNFFQPIIIIIMIPIGFLGAFWGHLLNDMMLTRFSTLGMVALAGIVINDSIVFIDAINYNLRHGMKLKDAVHTAGTSRLRPILLTTITTVAGLLPLMLETSFQAQFLIPMAVSVSYGLLFGSIFILFLVPNFILILNSIRFNLARFKYYILDQPFDLTHESVEPASHEESLKDLEEAPDV